MTTRCITTTWTDTDNHVVLLYGGDLSAYMHSGANLEDILGIIEVSTYKNGEHAGEAFIWNLHVGDSLRGKGYGNALLTEAIAIARTAGCHTAALEWQLKDSPQWVYDWYARRGFEESGFANGYALMKKKLNETE